MSLVPFRSPSALSTSSERVQSVIDLLPVYIELAGRIANTEFVPTALRRRPEAVLAALMSGAERGLGPMESLRSVHVIEGRPTLSAEAMRALVLAAGHEIEIVESSANRATLVGRRAGSDSTSPPFTWTLERARRARLATKDNWVKYPEAMLLARASTDLCRALFPDVIAGLASTEELTDEVTPDAPTTSRRRPAPLRSVGQAAAGATGPAPVAPALSGEIVGAAETHPSDAPAADATATDRADSVAVAEGDDPDDGIPGSDRPTWGTQRKPSQRPPERSQEHDPSLGRRIHAEIAKAFPDADDATRDRFRHALVAVITRKRPGGPVTSSSALNMEEQLFVSDILARVMSGQASVTDGPDATVEMRAGGGWRYSIEFDPLQVTVSQGEVDPGHRADDEPPPPTATEEETDG